MPGPSRHGVGSSYASAALLDRPHVHPQRTEIRRIEMMISDVTKRVQLYKVNVSSVTSDFTFKTEVTKVDRKELLAVENPRYQEMVNKYPHLKGVHIDDRDAKERLPIHLILGANNYAAIKIDKAPRVGRPGEPIAERTRLGWTVMSPGTENNLNNMLLAQTTVARYEHLCRLDVLGLEDRPPGDWKPEKTQQHSAQIGEN